MPSPVASLLVLLIYAALVFPGWIALTSVRWRFAATSFYVAVGGALIVYYLALAPRVPPAPPTGAAAGSLCEQLIAQSTAAGLILNRAGPNRVVVSSRLWRALPEDAKAGLRLCLQPAPASNGAPSTIEVIER